MTVDHWNRLETSTHQDHVIAHVIGTTVLGSFVFDESLYLLLDIGFIWQIYLDIEMGLLPFAVTIQELETDGEHKQQLVEESEMLLKHGPDVEGLQRIAPAPVECLIQEVKLYSCGDDRRLVLVGEEHSLAIETSCETRQLELRIADRELKN
jgi:hypothetical protein